MSTRILLALPGTSLYISHINGDNKQSALTQSGTVVKGVIVADEDGLWLETDLTLTTNEPAKFDEFMDAYDRFGVTFEGIGTMLVSLICDTTELQLCSHFGIMAKFKMLFTEARLDVALGTENNTNVLYSFGTHQQSMEEYVVGSSIISLPEGFIPRGVSLAQSTTSSNMVHEDKIYDHLSS